MFFGEVVHDVALVLVLYMAIIQRLEVTIAPQDFVFMTQSQKIYGHNCRYENHDSRQLTKHELIPRIFHSILMLISLRIFELLVYAILKIDARDHQAHKSKER